VDVSGGSGDIKVHTGAGAGVTIVRTVHYNTGHPHPSQVLQGGTLSFSSGCGGHCSIDYELTVPASMRVTAHADSGDVDVDGVATADLKTSSGSISADNIKGDVTAQVDSGSMKLSAIGGALNLSSDSGSINGTGLAGTVAQARVDSGDIRLDFTVIPTSVIAHADSGSLHLQAPMHPYTIMAHADSGSKHIEPGMSGTSANRLDLTADSGDITVDAI
jgi:DUF4097 and DUF4098 domain-containing protein YvlB